MLLDLIDVKKLRKALAYGLYMLVFLVLQNMVFSKISILGVKALFLPGMCAAVGLLEGGVFGGIFGLFCGFLSDMSFAENTVLFAVLYPIIGFFSGFAGKFLFSRRFGSYMVLAVFSVFFTAFCQGILAVAAGGSFSAILEISVKQGLWSAPLTAALYPPAHLIYSRFAPNERRK